MNSKLGKILVVTVALSLFTSVGLAEKEKNKNNNKGNQPNLERKYYFGKNKSYSYEERYNNIDRNIENKNDAEIKLNYYDLLPKGLSKNSLPYGLAKRINIENEDWYKNLPYGLSKRFNNNHIDENDSIDVYKEKLDELFNTYDNLTDNLKECIEKLEENIDDDVVINLYLDKLLEYKENYTEMIDRYHFDYNVIINKDDSSEINNELTITITSYIDKVSIVIADIKTQLIEIQSFINELKTEEDSYIETINKIKMYITEGQVLCYFASLEENINYYDQELVTKLKDTINLSIELVLKEDYDLDILVKQSQEIYDIIKKVKESKVKDIDYYRIELSRALDRANMVISDAKNEEYSYKYDSESVQLLLNEIIESVELLTIEDISIESIKLQHSELSLAVDKVLESYQYSVEEKIEELQLMVKEVMDKLIEINNSGEAESYSDEAKHNLYIIIIESNFFADKENITVDLINAQMQNINNALNNLLESKTN